MYVGFRYVLVAWAIGTTLAYVLCVLDILPAFNEVEMLAVGFLGATPAGYWVMASGFLLSMGSLVALPYFPCVGSDVCFLDVACIDQTDDIQTKRGISSIGCFLAHSTELRVLWSEPLFSRLWCIFEIAAYRKLNPQGKITVSPLFVESSMLRFFMWMHVLCFVFWTSRSLEGAVEFVNVFFLCLACLFFPMVHSMRHSCLSKHKMIAGLETFDVRDVDCLVESDKESIHAAIVSWYGSLDAFSEHVRGPFRQEVAELMRTPGCIPWHYNFFLVIPFFTMCLEASLSYWRAGAPMESILEHWESQLRSKAHEKSSEPTSL